MGVLTPLPRVDHEVAEAGARRCQGLRFPGFYRGGLDDGHQNSLRGVVAENNVRVLVVRHCTGRVSILRRSKQKIKIKTVNVKTLTDKRRKEKKL